MGALCQAKGSDGTAESAPFRTSDQFAHGTRCQDEREMHILAVGQPILLGNQDVCFQTWCLVRGSSGKEGRIETPPAEERVLRFRFEDGDTLKELH